MVLAARAATLARSTWGQSARLALGTASALGLARFAYGLVLPAMRGQLGWNLAQAGALTTANALGYLLGAVAVTVWARRLSQAAAFRLGMVLIVVALAATGVTGYYPVLLLTRAAAGFGGALVFISGGVLAARTAARTGSAAPITVYYSGAGLGITLSGVAIPAMLAHDPGRWPLAWTGLAAVGGLAAAISWTAAHGDHDPGATAALSGALGGVPRLWRPAAAYLLFGAGYITYITFLSAYLSAHHADVAAIAVTWALLGLAAVGAPLLWSRLIGTRPGTRALAILLAVLGAAAAAALASTATLAIDGSAIGYGATFLAVPAAVTALIRAATPPSQWAGTLSAFTIIFAAGQTAGPYLAGDLADHYGTGATLAWTAALCGVGAALSCVGTRQSSRDSSR